LLKDFRYVFDPMGLRRHDLPCPIKRELRYWLVVAPHQACVRRFCSARLLRHGGLRVQLLSCLRMVQICQGDCLGQSQSELFGHDGTLLQAFRAGKPARNVKDPMFVLPIRLDWRFDGLNAGQVRPSRLIVPCQSIEDELS
jgi:hypothetical protein